jgi:hypothetical protein
MAVEWEIADPKEKEATARAKWGDEEYERRVRVAAEKVEAMPSSGARWKEQIVLGGQFENIALAMSQTIFDKMVERDHKFWSNLVYKIVTGK